MAKDRSPRRRPETTARQNPKPQRRFRWRLLLALFPIVLVAGGTYVALRSPYLTVEKIKVQGTQNLDQASLAAISGLQGKSMLRLPLAQATQQLDAIPAVKTATIERNWPNAVTITIQERVPVAFWSIGGHDYPVDQDGVVLSSGAPDGPAPRIVEQGNDRIMSPGDRVHPDAVALALRIMTEAPSAFDQSVKELDYQTDVGVTVVFSGGMRVTFGDARSYEYKIAVLAALSDDLTARGYTPKSVDLRFGGRVTYE
ncbi:MAG TPA: FtsQ-type POTRA domain-containing protein [Dehalococcoidia bacterium]|nr:FtsQ-type POTRA domain-containing protein [Dehalococcoidia bacterium]